MASEKQICLNIMLCQMTAILSAVAMLYLAASLVIPSIEELSYEFNDDPIMCTTIKTVDSFGGGKSVDEKGEKIECKNFTCNEWCLSTPSSSCVKVTVMPRRNGSDIDFLNCDMDSTYDENCSALNVSLAKIYNCKKPECTELSGVYNCSKGDVENNPCTEITPAYDCEGNLDLKRVSECDEKCEPRLDGVYFCEQSECTKLKEFQSYEDCKRKCEDLSLGSKNVLMFGKERLVATRCTSVNSSSEKVSQLNNDHSWKSANRIIVLFCTYITKMSGGKYHTGDCFNATIEYDPGRLRNINKYLDLVEYRKRLYAENTNYLIDPEESLRLMNNTLLKINAEGCVNTLKSECKSFFRTHAVDGSDGKTPDRYRCYFTNRTDVQFVLGKYNAQETFINLMVGSIVPGCLFVISCLSLFVCSKTVGIDESGHLKVGRKELKQDTKRL